MRTQRWRIWKPAKRATASCSRTIWVRKLEIGPTIVLCRLLGWAFPPAKLHEKPMPEVGHASACQPAGRPGFFAPVRLPSLLANQDQRPGVTDHERRRSVLSG